MIWDGVLQGSGRWRAHQFHRRLAGESQALPEDLSEHCPSKIYILDVICNYAQLPQFFGHGAIAQILIAKGS